MIISLWSHFERVSFGFFTHCVYRLGGWLIVSFGLDLCMNYDYKKTRFVVKDDEGLWDERVLV